MERLILVTSVDVAEGVEEEFNRWYNEEHLPEVLACLGFISAVRYECTAGQPRFLAIYELETEAALTTPEMQRVRGWGEMFPHVRNFHERIYRRIILPSRAGRDAALAAERHVALAVGR